MPQRASVVAAFPATGKTWFADQHDGCADSDSSLWQRGDDWPEAYLDHIGRMRSQREVVLVSTHTEIRQGLAARGIPFTLVYPHLDLRDEYIQRLRDRGSPEGMRALIFSKWDRFLAECAFQRGCEHVVLGPGEYLADVLTGVRA